MNWDDVINHKYHSVPMPQFAEPVYTISSLTDEFSTKPIQRFGQRQSQRTQNVQVFQQKKGHPISFIDGGVIVVLFLIAFGLAFGGFL